MTEDLLVQLLLHQQCPAIILSHTLLIHLSTDILAAMVRFVRIQKEVDAIGEGKH